MTQSFDYDVAVVGSGFGGSVAALRLSQKGYRVGVLEMGRRWTPSQLPKTSLDLKRYLWMPALGLYGLQQMDLLRHALVLSGVGVGGGSLVYGNTLFMPMDSFFASDPVQRLGGYGALRPYYDLALKMMGAVPNPRLQEPDRILREVAASYGRGDTFTPSPVGIYFGEPGQRAPDPYFAGEGPERVGCTSCGGCFTGCRVGAKNTLDRNYLHLAERLGAEIVPETRVTAVRPLGEAGGVEGYALDTRPGVGGGPGRTLHARGVVVAAGVMGTLRLLTACRDDGHLRGLSDRLGHDVRTNSESIVGVRARADDVNYSRGIAASSSAFPDPHTQVQADRYGDGSDLMAAMTTLMVDGGGDGLPRPLRWLGEALRKPLDAVRASSPSEFARRTIILVVMQDRDSSLRVVRRRLGPLSVLASEDGDGPRAPTYIPIANDFARRMADQIDGVPISSTTEVFLGAPATAHILGGCLMADSPSEGVVDRDHRVFGYQNLWVCDGSVIPANLGANPVLSILAFAERAMARVPLRDGARHRPLAVDRLWGTAPLLNPASSP